MPSMLVLSETHLTDAIEDHEVKIENYTLVRCDSDSRSTGGVAIYVHNSIDFYVLQETRKNKTWMLSISIDEGEFKGIYTAVYKSPKVKTAEFIQILDHHLKKVVTDDRRHIIIGDTNLNVSRKTKNVRDYIEKIEEYDLKQIINDYTRVKGKSMTIIDHVITNVEDQIKWRINPVSPTDHFLIEIHLNVRKSQSHLKKKNKLTSWKFYSAEKLNEKLNQMNWTNIDENDHAKNLINNLKLIVESLVMKKQHRVNQRWYTPKLREIKRNLAVMREIYFYTRDDETLQRLSELNREYKNEIRSAKSAYVQERIKSNMNDSKKLWRVLKSLYKSTDDELKGIYFDGKFVKNSTELAEKLNENFVETIEKLVAGIPQSTSTDYLEKIPICNADFSFHAIEIDELRDIIKELKDKTYHDNVNGRVLQDALNNDEFAKELLKLVNDSICNSILPNELKTSTVTPINKINNPQNPEDLRPINNLPVIEKIIESVVYKQLIQHVNENHILSDHQSGFRSNHSTESAILTVLHEWIVATEDKKKILAVFLDLKRAFETVDREIMLKKLKIYGLSEKAIGWFRSYLSDRKQVTRVNGEFSSPIDVNHGLPQGSKLSNLLFILFINDITYNAPGVNVNLYADDALLFITSDDIDHASCEMNNALDVISDWLRFNRMALNVKKCNAMLINNDDNDIDIKIDGEIIENVESVKYLGVMIDRGLKFDNHVEMIKKKINKRVGLLGRLNNKMTHESKIIYLKSLILPLYDNCSSILMMVDEGMIIQIQRCVNKALRLILKADRMSSVEEMIKKLNISSVRDRIFINALKFVNKTILKGFPTALAKIFKLRKDVRCTSRELRSDNTYNIPYKWQKKSHEKSIFYRGLILYNDYLTKFKNDEKFNENCKIFIKDVKM